MAGQLHWREEQKAFLLLSLDARASAHCDTLLVLEVAAASRRWRRNRCRRRPLSFWLDLHNCQCHFLIICNILDSISHLPRFHKHHNLGVPQLGQDLVPEAVATQVWQSFQHRSSQELAFVLLFQSDWRQLLCMALAQKETRYNPPKIIIEYKYDDADYSPTKYSAAECSRWRTC